jgi:hypothetical protein
MTFYKTLMQVILTLYYSQQTLVFCWCLMTEKINGTLYIGNLSTVIFCCAIIGNMSLGPFKGYIDKKINNNRKGRIIAGIIPQIIFAGLIISIYYNNSISIILSLVTWHLIGMPFISASDCLMDESSSIILESSSKFAFAQYIGTKIIARIGFSYITDNYEKLKDIISIASLISAMFGIIVHLIALNYYKEHNNQVYYNTKEIDYNKKNKYSIFWFAPLFFVIFEAFFLDTSLSSLKFITPRFIDDNTPAIFSSTFISTSEIIVSIIFTIIISFSKDIEKFSFKNRWEKYTKLHLISTVSRIFLTIILVYLMNIQVVQYNTNDYIIANVTQKSFNETKIIHYGISRMANLDVIKFIILLLTVVNASIDSFSSIILIVLLKTYSENLNIRYSFLDGFIRFFTYLPVAIPWIKRNKMLSVYNSEGYLVNTLSWSILVYGVISYWNWRQMRKVKND